MQTSSPEEGLAKMAAVVNDQVKLGPHQRWCLARHNLRSYIAVQVGLTYVLPSTLPFAALERCFKSALVHLLQQPTHPLLSCAVADDHTDQPYWSRINAVDVTRCVEFVDIDEDWGVNGSACETAFEKVLASVHRRPFESEDKTMPLWRLTVVRYRGDVGKVTALWTYNHALGDGMSGLIFHAALLKSLEAIITRLPPDEVEEEAFIAHPLHSTPIAPSLEKVFNVKPTLSFLFPLVLTELLLPTWASQRLGLKRNYWQGTKLERPLVETFPVPETNQRRLLLSSKQWTTFKALTKQTQFSPTTLLQALQAYATWLAFPSSRGQVLKYTTPMNLRAAASVPKETIGNFVGAFIYDFVPPTITDYAYPPSDLLSTLNEPSNPVLPLAKSYAAKINQKNLARESSMFVGSLSLIGDGVVPQTTTAWTHNTKMCAFIRSKVSGDTNPKGTSGELSNLGLFCPPPEVVQWGVKEATFSQNAGPMGSPVDMCAVATAEGGLVLCWAFESGAVREEEVGTLRDIMRCAFEGLI